MVGIIYRPDSREPGSEVLPFTLISVPQKHCMLHFDSSSPTNEPTAASPASLVAAAPLSAVAIVSCSSSSVGPAVACSSPIYPYLLPHRFPAPQCLFSSLTAVSLVSVPFAMCRHRCLLLCDMHNVHFFSLHPKHAKSTSTRRALSKALHFPHFPNIKRHSRAVNT
jgi:hypothetical protein